MSEQAPGDLIRGARERAGMTRDELAARVNVSLSTLYRVEVRGHTPRATTAAAIAAVLDLAMDEIIPASVVA